MNKRQAVQDKKGGFALCIKITESFELWATSSDPIVAGWHVGPLVHVQVGHHVAGQVDT